MIPPRRSTRQTVGTFRVAWRAGRRARIIACVVITASATTRARELVLEPLVVTGTRENPPGSGPDALATESWLDTHTHGSWLETFAPIPGLITQPGHGAIDPPRLALRGSGIQSAPTSRGLWISFLDLPLNAADGSFNLSLLENSWLQSAVVARGSAAGVPALGGSLAFGGSDDLFTRGGSVAAGYGSEGSTALAAAGGGAADHLALSGRAAHTATDGWRPHARQDRHCLVTGVRMAWDDDSDLTIQVLGSHPWYEVPGPLTRHDAMARPRSVTAAVERDQPRRESEYLQVAARATKLWTGAAASLAVGGVSYQDDFRQLLANGISTTDALETYLIFQAQKDWDTTRNHHTGFAARLQSGWWDARRYRNDHGQRGPIIGNQRLRPLTFTGAIDHRIAITPRQQLELGASALTAKRDIHDNLGQPAAQPVDLTWSGTRGAARAAWSWSPFGDTTLVAAWSRSYEPPTYHDLMFTDGPPDARVLRSASLAWQRADSVELSARGRHQALSWSTSLYHSRWRDEFLRLANPDGSTRGTVNAGRTVHSGCENSIRWDFLPDSAADLTAWATYNYTFARFDDDPVYGDGRLGGVPPHTGALGLRAASAGGWFVAPALQWQAGSTYADHSQDLRYGGFCLWSLELGRIHPAGWTATVGIHNIFNQRAIVSTTGVLDRAPDPDHTAIFLPANHRTVELRLEYRW